MTFSAVLLISQNQNVALWPLHRLLDRPTETALTARAFAAPAYPTTRRFRRPARRWSCTASSCSSSCSSPRSERSSTHRRTRPSRDAGAGWTHRVDVNGTLTQGNPIDVLRSGPFAGRVVDVMPLVIGHATATDPGHRTEDALPVTVVGLRTSPKAHTSTCSINACRDSTTTRRCGRRIASDPKYVVVDAFFGSGGGPQGQSFHPGDTFTDYRSRDRRHSRQDDRGRDVERQAPSTTSASVSSGSP